MNTSNSTPNTELLPSIIQREGSPVYQIEIQGPLTPDWAEWFEGMTIYNHPDGKTILIGRLPDQAALHGLLAKIRDLGLVLLALNQLEPDQ